MLKIVKMKKKKAERLKAVLAPQLMTHPLFMFYCPDKPNRGKFIDNFLDYYLYSWTKFGEAYESSSKNIMASLVSLGAFEYGFSGKNSLKMKLNKYSKNILSHRRSVQEIIEIVMPPNIETRVLTLYGSTQENMNDMLDVVDEIIAHAKERGFSIAYETFSRRTIDAMLERGFCVAYQKKYLDSQFVQTVMTYNV